MIQPINMENSKYSLGTTPVFNTLLNEISRKENPVEIVLFNVATIIRNCMHTEKITNMIKEEKRRGQETNAPSLALLNETKKEIATLMNDIVAMFNDNQAIMNPTLIAYFCDYRKTIPTASRREEIASKKTLFLAEDMLIHAMTPRRSVTKARNVTLIEIPILTGKFPHVILADELGYIKNNHNIGHISNHPIDYHICKYTSSYRLIQSFTGKVLTTGELPEKVFGSSDIPFCPATHAVLGDKEDVKPSLSPSVKKKMYEVAKQEHWAIHTPEWLEERMYQIGVRVPFKMK